mmetsp:Transcript_20344/g.60672  ORF Transcript_20344/g.60672 Transcript_20344/m.60672 type:complete len:293 (-) Transcript_20344:122-1000(-)
MPVHLDAVLLAVLVGLALGEVGVHALQRPLAGLVEGRGRHVAVEPREGALGGHVVGADPGLVAALVGGVVRELVVEEGLLAGVVDGRQVARRAAVAAAPGVGLGRAPRLLHPVAPDELVVVAAVRVHLVAVQRVADVVAAARPVVELAAAGLLGLVRQVRAAAVARQGLVGLGEARARDAEGDEPEGVERQHVLRRELLDARERAPQAAAAEALVRREAAGARGRVEEPVAERRGGVVLVHAEVGHSAGFVRSALCASGRGRGADSRWCVFEFGRPQRSGGVLRCRFRARFV